MTEDDKQATDQVAGAIKALMAMLVAQGHDPRHVLAAAHAVAVSEIAAVYGGPVAAERARAAAQQVEGLPPASLAWAMETEGRPC
ncbi:hypothetical protein [Mangrovicoccus ximenensis]|uniref:hypothetical protein n=1 Tax=Mangrovicoccus ximenensis TaxID=1911570 RepID=UPI001374CC97|nr:hypothetical protein [Mangrovicoccus ximenensis]